MCLEYIKHSISSMCRKPFKTFLTIFSISIAAASVVLITAISESGRKTVAAEMASMGMNGITIGAEEKNAQADLGIEELNIIRGNDNVSQAAPVIVSYTEAKMRGLVADALIWGIDQAADDVVSFTLEYGRMLNGSDISAARKVCVVDENFAQAFYKRDNIVGKQMRLLLPGGYEYFTVVGVVKSGGSILQGLMAGYIPSFVYIPYSAVTEWKETSFDQIVVKIKNSDLADQTGRDLQNALDSANNISRGYHVQNILQQKQSLDKIMYIFTLILSCVAGISLIVAGLGIMTVMMVSVSERTREIGIKKSLGASRRIIAAEFLTESALMSLTGGIIGISVGNLIGWLGALTIGLPYNHRLMSDLMFLTAALILGGIFGVYPAWKASQLNPVDALRYH